MYSIPIANYDYRRKIKNRKRKQSAGNLPTNCLSVFDHFVGLAFKVLVQSLKSISERVYLKIAVGYCTTNVINMKFFASFFKKFN